ncbi:MAG: hypothetical protein WBC51_21480 [Vicinamibacterales bacterium]
MRPLKPPEWLDTTDSWYYSHIQRPSAYVVTVRRIAADQEVTDERPGTPILRLHPRFGSTRVFDAAGGEQGVIRSEGIVRGRCFVMRRNATVVWVSTVRSFVRKRHRLRNADGEVWTFDTPFFWWQHLTGIVSGQEGLIGRVGPTKRHWGLAVEPGRDTFELLSAVAFMHWKWTRW